MTYYETLIIFFFCNLCTITDVENEHDEDHLFYGLFSCYYRMYRVVHAVLCHIHPATTNPAQLLPLILKRLPDVEPALSVNFSFIIPNRVLH